MKEHDLDLLMPTWIPEASAGDIRNIYDFNPDETRIQVAKVFLSGQSRSSFIDCNRQPNAIVDFMDVDRRWGRNITDPRENFEFILRPTV